VAFRLAPEVHTVSPPYGHGMPEIAAHRLTKDFGRTRAVDNVSFELEPGRVVGLIGPNGSGKTTTLRMLLGLVAPTSGWIHIGDRPFAKLTAPARQVGAVLENRCFHPGRTAGDHLRVLATEGSLPLARVATVLELAGLTEAADRRAGTFSLGMGQRLSLASALLGDPGILLLDEPTNGLDPAGIRWLRGLLRDLATEGRMVVVSSHVLAEVEQTVDEVLILNGGRLLAHISVSDIDSLEDTFLNLTGEQEAVA
jgi:ABC-2 type transport system ATP-binding protein